ncbi:magnesium transporter [Synechococcus sp. PROS-7-1]|uniref:magnesium/cobalt transporter CorA n=1 Tax=Synechococcus sp. PROS-7-1 TaxID=1442556 RepID=UPI001645F1A6|nr:magnesium/cobalt transporter CorA [Synechococcus sp. PROS-7-1]QNI85227.1 magnesium transporter [Synechococcus sp. PROS-7-1]
MTDSRSDQSLFKPGDRLAPDSIPEPLPLLERPGDLPAHLFLHGGKAPFSCKVLQFNDEVVSTFQVHNYEEFESLIPSQALMWLQFRGLANIDLLRQYLSLLSLEPSVIDIILTFPQKSRITSTNNSVLAVLHEFSLATDPTHLISTQYNLVLTNRMLITIQENPQRTFNDLEAWLNNKTNNVKAIDLDNLFHFVVDDILDSHLPMLESMSVFLDDLEERALLKPKPSILNRAYQVRFNHRVARRQLWPLRNELIILLRQSQRLLGPVAREGLHDMADHVNTLLEIGDSIRLQLNSINDAYMASTGNVMNQIIKTLTIVSTIFAPLTFIAGIYGMNFENMPELKWKYGYLYSLILMTLIALFQAYFLWKRGWFQDLSGRSRKFGP